MAVFALHGLHAQELTLPNGLELKAPLPKDMASLINQLQKYS
jgi:hypothetical protein